MASTGLRCNTTLSHPSVRLLRPPSFALALISPPSVSVLRSHHNLLSRNTQYLEAQIEYLEYTIHNQSLYDLLRICSNCLFHIQLTFGHNGVYLLITNLTHAFADAYFRSEQSNQNRD